MLSLNFNMGNRLVKPIDGRTINILLKNFSNKLWPVGQKKIPVVGPTEIVILIHGLFVLTLLLSNSINRPFMILGKQT